jgi:hypothetical protein
MRLRIVRPLPKELEGCYDLRAALADLLLATGYAIPEDAPNIDESAPPHRQPHR